MEDPRRETSDDLRRLFEGVSVLTDRSQIARQLEQRLVDADGPVFVHSDVARAMGGVMPARDRNLVLSRHLDLLMRVSGGRPLWMPTFNYGFTTNGVFDVRTDPSEVGVLSEHFRTHGAAWRSSMPVFSVAGQLAPVVERGWDVWDPFDTTSAFAALVEQGGTILFYGAPMASCTFIHHAERTAGGPIYRYDKLFRGSVRTEAGMVGRTLRYHVRPRGRQLDYDWRRLADELRQEGILTEVRGPAFSALAVEASRLRAYWVQRIEDDPLHLLDESSRHWVRDELDRLGRPFTLADFEDL